MVMERFTFGLHLPEQGFACAPLETRPVRRPVIIHTGSGAKRLNTAIGSFQDPIPEPRTDPCKAPVPQNTRLGSFLFDPRTPTNGP